AVGIFDAVLFEMFREFSEIIDLKSEVSEVGLDLNGAAGREITNFDEFFAGGSFEEDEFGTARGFVAADFQQAEHIDVKTNRFFKLVHAVAGVQQLFDSAHSRDNNW